MRDSYWATMAPCYLQLALLGQSKEEWDRTLRSETTAREFTEKCLNDSEDKTRRLEEHDMVIKLVKQYRDMALTTAERNYKELSFFDKLASWFK